jgi:hypothetical protein
MNTTPQWKTKKDAPAHLGSPSMLFIDLIAFSCGAYMLAASARKAQELYESFVAARPDHKRPRVDCYLLQVINEGDIPMVCHFACEAKHQIREHNRRAGH